MLFNLTVHFIRHMKTTTFKINFSNHVLDKLSDSIHFWVIILLNSRSNLCLFKGDILYAHALCFICNPDIAYHRPIAYRANTTVAKSFEALKVT